jgi:hypothetical protein
MRKTAHFVALMMASTALTSAHAATNYEYTSQPNLAQIQVTKALHDAFYTAYIDPNRTTNTGASKLIVAIFDGLADSTHVDLNSVLSDNSADCQPSKLGR